MTPRALHKPSCELVFVLGTERSVAHAVIANNALTRGALTAVLWLFSPPWQIRVFTSMQDGDAWLRESLNARGLSQTAPPRAWWRDLGADD